MFGMDKSEMITSGSDSRSSMSASNPSPQQSALRILAQPTPKPMFAG
jgi:hypothetical protein